METSPRSDVRGALKVRSERERCAARTPRRSTSSIDEGHTIISGFTAAAPIPAKVRPDNPRHALSAAAEQLLAEARAACRRDAVPASQRELFARIAKRTGLTEAEVAQGLRGHTRATPSRRATADVEDDPTAALAARILGIRERTVFLARRNAAPHDIAGLHRLASQLGVSVDRVYQLEASARHKLATALR